MTDTPRRIQLSRAKGWRMPENTVKVDRSTGFGNPFPVIKGKELTGAGTKPIWQVGHWNGPAIWFKDNEADALALSVEAFGNWMAEPAQAPLGERVRLSLRGKNLACWCKLGDPCHADVLLELANAPSCEAVSP